MLGLTSLSRAVPQFSSGRCKALPQPPAPLHSISAARSITSCHTHTAGTQLRLPTSPTLGCRQQVVCQAKKSRFSQDPYGRGRPSDTSGEYDFDLNGTRIRITQGNLWSLAIPGLMVLSLAALIGPLIIGVALAAVAVGAAMSVGAFAMSLFWLPFMAMFGFLAMSFLFPFGVFATFGLSFLMPKLLSLGIALGGVALGWQVVSRMITANSSATSEQAVPGQRGKKGYARPGLDDGPIVMADASDLDPEEEKEERRRAAELRDFDRMMAERERQKQQDERRRSRF